MTEKLISRPDGRCSWFEIKDRGFMECPVAAVEHGLCAEHTATAVSYYGSAEVFPVVFDHLIRGISGDMPTDEFEAKLREFRSKGKYPLP